jgi:dienelactone hydrolase
MGIRTRQHGYRENGVDYEARVCWDDSYDKPRPAVLVSHAWRGRSDFENAEAERLAGMGYVGFALDLYGKGVIGKSPEENRGLMQPYLDDRALLWRKLGAAIREVQSLPEVDDSKLAAIGFCFGGLCVLDLARNGAEVRGVASFHGLLSPSSTIDNGRFDGSVLVLHGWDDPMAPPEHVVALGREMTALGADWQLYAYGQTLHAFTNPEANDPAHGLKFEPRTNNRARIALASFLSELFE